MSWTSTGIPFLFQYVYTGCSMGVFFVVKLGFVLRKPISSLGLLSTDVTVPKKMAGKVDALQMVLYVHLPAVAESIFLL